MTTKGRVKPCRRCGRHYLSTLTHKSLCPDCPPSHTLTGKCPSCGKPMRRDRRVPGNAPCWECKGRAHRERSICPDCGGKKTRQSPRCGRCAGKLRQGERSRNWKGGRYFNSNGYVMIWGRNHPRAHSNGYVLEHIRVWMAAYGPVAAGHVLHHLNGVKSDNRLENLATLPRGKHETLSLIHAMQARIHALETLLSDRSIP